MKDDRREWRRVPLDVIAKCRSTQEATYYHIHLTDMHHQGCCFNSATEFEKGREVRIVVDMPVLGNLYLVGVVVWTASVPGEEPYRVGISFQVQDPIAIENSSKLYSYLISR